MAKRDLEETSVVATGVQSFDDRFGRGRRFTFDTPPISQWRCNLTALSQVHNLYFVAYREHVYVYIPQFPKQQIADQPALRFTSLPSSLGLRGHIDPRSPHSINSLIVQFLGTEEVVAVVRDDGDVDAFLVRHVVQAIERREEPGNTIGSDGDEIRPFYQSNVGHSAWGLAIHSEARILAVSSNACEVTVVKFGLFQPDDDDDESIMEDEEVSPEADRGEGDREKQRKVDVTSHVINGNSNIPFIAFCNTGDDPEGRWLLTTDISGMCRVMDMQDMQLNQAFRFGRSCATTRDFHGFDRVNAGWAIMFLDKRSFQLEDDVCVAVGAQDESALSIRPSNGDCWDLSETVHRFSESSEPFILHQSRPPARNDHQIRQAHRAEEDAFITTSSNAQHQGIERRESGDGGASVVMEIDLLGEVREENVQEGAGTYEEGDQHGNDLPDHRYSETDYDERVHEEEDDPTEVHEDFDGGIAVDSPEPVQEDIRDQRYEFSYETGWRTESPDQNGESTYASSPRSVIGGDISDRDEDDPNSGEDVDSDPDLVDDDLDPFDEGTEDTISYTSFYNGSVTGNEPSFQFRDRALCNALPCPVLHASVRNVYLLQPSNPDSAYNGPFLGFANPLRQTIHRQFAYLRMFERLNMSAYIQSLGIVVLASQKGRALVLSLTRVHPTARYPHRKGHWYHNNSSNYCMRAECILPFEHQEKANQRPGYPLHGIAVGPLQGSQDLQPGMRRWRLMLMYQDHSILSYEIGRNKAGIQKDAGVDVSSLFV